MFAKFEQKSYCNLYIILFSSTLLACFLRLRKCPSQLISDVPYIIALPWQGNQCPKVNFERANSCTIMLNSGYYANNI